MKVRNLIIVLLAVSLLAACTRDNRQPGRSFMPDMAYSIPYDAYTNNPNFADSLTSRVPVSGTIKRGTFSNDTVNSLYFRYAHYSGDSNGDYMSSGTRLLNPIANNEENIKEGQRLYKIHCDICHGDGTGNGHIVVTEKFPAPPVSYFDPRLMAMPEGQMFHVLQYGRNMMGSYASQLNAEQRWKVIRYIKALQAEYASSQGTGEEATDSQVDSGQEADNS